MSYDVEPDGRIVSPSCERNKGPILERLQTILDGHTQVLEVGSYTGQHASYFSANLDIPWQPTDVEPIPDSINGWCKFEGATKVAPPFPLDLFDPFPEFEADTLVCINAIHIAPWPATRRLFELGTQVLSNGGKLVLYGPFKYRDHELEPSNVKFDAWLHERYPGGGIRVFEDINEIASELGYTLGEDISMPANNHLIWWSLPGLKG